MSSTTTILSLPLLSPSQAQKTVIHNEALAQLDYLVQTAVEDRSRTAPPSSPVKGDMHVVAVGASGAWAGRDTQLAIWNGTAWEFHAPKSGWRAWVKADQEMAYFNGTAWQSPSATASTVPQLGVNTTSDTTNRLVVRAAAALFTGETAGHQVKVNKLHAGDTASLLFQDNYSGRAEMGLVGDDNFAVKVSADGASFVDALKADAATGKVSLPQGANLGSMASDPASPANGDVWYNTTLARFRGRQGGSVVDLIGGVLSNNFATRAAALAWLATEAASDGALIGVGGFAFRKKSGATAIADMPNWLPADEVYPDHFAENTTPGTTDMGAAILAAANYVGYDGIVNGANTLYAVGAPMDVSSLYGVIFRGLRLAAVGSWAAGTPFFLMSKASAAKVDLTFENCFFEGNGKANGISITNCSRVTVQDCKMHGTPDYAVRSRTSAGELLIAGCNFRQFYSGETGWNLAANRTAKLIDIQTSDCMISDTVAAYCLVPLSLTNGFYHGQVTGCHFYNDGYTPVSGDPLAADIGARNVVLSDNYFDNGVVSVDGQMLVGAAGLVMQGNLFAKTAAGINAHLVEFRNAGAACDLGGLVFTENLYHGVSESAAVVFTGSFASPLAWVTHGNVLSNGVQLTNVPMSQLGSGFSYDTTAGIALSRPMVTTADFSAYDANFMLKDEADPTKVAKFGLGSLPTGATTTFYLPNTGGTLLCNAASATITGQWTVTANMTVNDQNFILRDGVDTTKKASFELAGLTTGTTRTYGLPDATGALALDTTFTSAAKGLVPASGGGTVNFLRADGTWAAPAAGGGGVSDGDKGDVVVSGAGAVWSLDYTAVNAVVAPVWANITATPTTIAGYGITDGVTLAGTQTISGTKNFQAATLQFGGGAGAGTISIASGTTSTGNTKTIAIGPNGASGSTTNVTIGSATAGASGTLTIHSPTTAFGATATAFNVPDSVFTLLDAADPTKQARFDLSGITTGTTRTLSLPDADGMLGLARQSGVLAADYALTSTTAVQKLFNWSPNGALQLAAGYYLFKCIYVITGMSATSGNAAFNLLGAGTATLGTVLFNADGIDSTNPTTAGTSTGSASQTTASVASIVTAGTGTAMRVAINGAFQVTATGTIVPSVALVTASAAVVKAGSLFTCEWLGAGNATGSWS